LVFSSIEFLFLFLPVCLILFFAAPGSTFKKVVLLLMSMLFYAWGEREYTVVMLASIGITWFFGLKIEAAEEKKRNRLLTAGVIINLGLLLYFKFGNFIVDNFNVLTSDLGPKFHAKVHHIHLPIGISFFTFQAISYLIDIYRQDVRAQKKLWVFAMYKSFFPQLIAGPIVRYRDIAGQIEHFKVRWEDFSEGAERFVIGLCQKVLIANTLGHVADEVFSLPAGQQSTLFSWIGIISYTLQIYFDFAGYSSMAIGLGRMFGLKFLENFNFPYTSKSITEFWRRWHISLSSWFRDYLYIPLGGNRGSQARTLANLMIVFVLCGLWHGASWTFFIWGLFHGIILVIERQYLLKILKKIPQSLAGIYTILMVMLGWVFFRADTLANALHFIKTMFVFQSVENPKFTMGNLITNEYIFFLILGILFSSSTVISKFEKNPNVFLTSLRFGALTVGLILSLISLSANNFNPFIYFRF
jgi:alginate O-acetyltransferase complex protein AlgI